MNLTDQQKDLLRLLVAMHESLGGGPFILVRAPVGYGLVYGGFSISIKGDEFDFRDLRRERCISFVPIGTNKWNGKPTGDGIAMIRRGFHGRRLMWDFEARCPLLSAAAGEQLQQAGDAREAELSYRIEMAATIIRTRREEVSQVQGEDTKKIAGSILERQIRILRQSVFKAAEAAVSEGVREFADGLIATQGRLGVYALSLRSYTAEVVSAFRRWLNSSEAFQLEPLLPWQQDSLTQKAIQTCEQVLAERRTIENTGSKGSEDENPLLGEPRTWSPLVQDWEALKSDREATTSEVELIPDSDLCRLAQRYLVEPGEVTEDQIELAACELCRHYGLFRIIPPPGAALDSSDGDKRKADPIQDARFWKDREGEFGEHDAESDRVLGARWFSSGNYWTFHTGNGGSLSAKLVDTFKSRAREAAKGLGSQGAADSWKDWLDLLRYAADEDTGKLLYVKNCTGSHVIGEREKHRMLATGEVTLGSLMTEFVRTEDGGVEKRWYSDTQTSVIENLFENSAHCCRRLRSLTPPVAEGDALALAQRDSEQAPLSAAPKHAQGPAANVPPSRVAIEELANSAFAIANDRIAQKHAKDQSRVLNEVASRGNIGAYPPSLTNCKAEQLRASILAWADAYVESFALHGMPCDAKVEKDLETASLHMAGGSISAVVGQLDLVSMRTRQPLSEGGHVRRELEKTRVSALSEGILRLKRQRITMASAPKAVAEPSRAGKKASLTPTSAGTAEPETGGAAPQSSGRKRGRPQIIPDETKAAAATLKTQGGTNREVAALLYGKKYPSAQETKNVSAILRHYEKSKQSSSSAKPSKSSPKPIKIRG